MTDRLQAWLLRTWYGAPTRGRWLLPLAWLFAAAVRLRRIGHARGWLPRYRSTRPVIVVGNLTVGGTGKTPLVIWLARELAARGVRPGIASRGYRGAGGPARRLTAADSAGTAGDEAWMLWRKLCLPVAIGARRRDAVRLLESGCDVILCDDGLQHHGLDRDFEIAVVDGSRGLGNGRLLPAGPLREPSRRLVEVDAVVVNGAGFRWQGAVHMELKAGALVALDGGARRPLAEFAGQKVMAAAAIGNPERFFALLRAHGLEPEERTLPDHRALTPAAAGVGMGLPVLMTEKDAVKCAGSGWQGAWYLEAEACIDPASAVPLLARITDVIAARSKGNTQRD